MTWYVCYTISGTTTYKCTTSVELIHIWHPKKVVSPDEVTHIASSFWQWQIWCWHCSVWDHVFELCLYTLPWLIVGGPCINSAKMFFEKIDNASQKMQLKNLQDFMQLMNLSQQPQMSSSFSAGSRPSKFLCESSKVMLQPTKTSAQRQESRWSQQLAKIHTV